VGLRASLDDVEKRTFYIERRMRDKIIIFTAVKTSNIVENEKGVKSGIQVRSSTYVTTISGFLNPCRG
jgi:hypothetical protein